MNDECDCYQHCCAGLCCPDECLCADYCDEWPGNYRPGIVAAPHPPLTHGAPE